MAKGKKTIITTLDDFFNQSKKEDSFKSSDEPIEGEMDLNEGLIEGRMSLDDEPIEGEMDLNEGLIEGGMSLDDEPIDEMIVLDDEPSEDEVDLESSIGPDGIPFDIREYGDYVNIIFNAKMDKWMLEFFDNGRLIVTSYYVSKEEAFDNARRYLKELDVLDFDESSNDEGYYNEDDGEDSSDSNPNIMAEFLK